MTNRTKTILRRRRVANAQVMHKSLHGLRCPYCKRRGVVALLVFDRETMTNRCPTCKERLVAE